MLNGMRHTWHVSLVAEVSHIDIHAGAGLVCLRIMDKKCLKLVGESNDAVSAIIQRRRLEVIRNQLRRAGLVFYDRHLCLAGSVIGK